MEKQYKLTIYYYADSEEEAEEKADYTLHAFDQEYNYIDHDGPTEV